jgi:parallel beta-helix repeat protein
LLVFVTGAIAENITIIGRVGSYETIQKAIDASVDGETIEVDDGTYKGFGNVDIDYKGKKIILKSKNGADNCIIDCEKKNRAFYFKTLEISDSVLDGFTIINGWTEHGGTIRCGEHRPRDSSGNLKYDEYELPGPTENTGSPLIQNCIIKNCYSAYDGAAIACNSSSPQIINCIITNNSTPSVQYGYGAGISARNGSNPVIDGCVISNNSAYWGAGIYLFGSDNTAVIKNSVIKNNWSRYDGGGISLWESSPIIQDSVIWGNSSYFGAGISAKNISYPEISNCVIAMNYSEGFGGGVYAVNASDVVVKNCTIVENQAYGGKNNYWLPAGGVYNGFDGTISVESSVIWGNGVIEAGYYPLTDAENIAYPSIQDSCIFDAYTNAGLYNSYTLNDDDGDTIETIFLDPGFPGNGDYSIPGDSPCRIEGVIVMGANEAVIAKSLAENIQPRASKKDDKEYYECFISSLFAE